MIDSANPGLSQAIAFTVAIHKDLMTDDHGWKKCWKRKEIYIKKWNES